MDGARTPFLKARGKPGPFTPVDLAVHAGRPLLARQPFDAAEIDDVILGCAGVLPGEANPARVATLRLGLGDDQPAWTVQRNCASGMQSVESGYREIADGRADIVLAGGTESLSQAPLIYRREAVNWFARLASAKSTGQKIGAFFSIPVGALLNPVIGLVEGLTDPVVEMNMGQTAEVLADRFKISREQADAYALESHRRLASAQQREGGVEEVEHMYGHDGTLYSSDDGVRPDNTMEQLGKLKPAFERPYGKVTAGNSSQITDGGCWLILASDEAVKRHKLEPLGRIMDSQWAALDPSVMGLGPVFSSTPILERNSYKLSDIDYWEINEAFAAQVLACLAVWREKDYSEKVLGRAPLGEVPMERLNVDGGAISLGHPVGTSGARITLHLFHVLKRNKAKRGIATLCVGGGQGGALLLEAA